MSTSDPTAEPGGPITVTVAVPDGWKVPPATVWMHPETAGEFEQTLDALGGIIAAATIGTDFASFDIPGGQTFLYWPRDLEPAPVQTPGQAFARSLRDRQRAALDLMRKLDESFQAGSA